MPDLSAIDWNAVAATAAVVGLLLTGIGSIYAGLQLRMSRKIASTDFDFRLLEQIQEYNDVDRRLKGEGWPDGKAGPDTAEEWHRVERYMGLLETIQGLVDDGIINLDKVDKY